MKGRRFQSLVFCRLETRLMYFLALRRSGSAPMISTVPELQQTPKSTHCGPALEAQAGVAKSTWRSK